MVGWGIVDHPRRCRGAAGTQAGGVAVGATGGSAIAAGTAGSAGTANTGARGGGGGGTGGNECWGLRRGDHQDHQLAPRLTLRRLARLPLDDMGNRVLRQLALTPHRAQLAARFMTGGPESRLEVQRRAYRKVASRVTKTLEIESDGSRFLVHPSDGPIAEQMFVFGSFNAGMTETAVSVMTYHLGPDPIEGKMLLDIGANIGTTSIPAVTKWGASRYWRSSRKRRTSVSFDAM